jgi:pimeloyl-ACP methyl ester carboxylesterase
MSGLPQREGHVSLGAGRRVAWSEWGPPDGRPVVLLEGMPGSSHYCPDVDATMDLGVRLISVDRPGYGHSDPLPGRTLADWPSDLAVLLQDLAIDAVPVAGWSSGAPFAIACAVALPRVVTALALLAGDAPIDEVGGGLAAMPRERQERIALTRADPAAARRQALQRAQFYADDPESIVPWRDAPPSEAEAAANPDAALFQAPEQRAALLEMFRHGAHQGAAGWVDDSIALSRPWGFALSAVACPTKVWFGAGDRIGRRADSEYLARAIPGAELVIEPHDGHSVPVRHWREILEWLLAA